MGQANGAPHWQEVQVGSLGNLPSNNDGGRGVIVQGKLEKENVISIQFILKMLLKAHTYTKNQHFLRNHLEFVNFKLKKKILMIDYYDIRYFFTLVLVVKTRLIVILCPVHYCFVVNISQLKVTLMTYGFEMNI